MKLVIKNLKQVPHNVEVPNDQVTVKDLKIEIEKAHGFDHTLLKLLSNGVVLDDAKTLASYEIKEDFVIIMMNTKPKPVEQPKQAEVNPQPVEAKKEEKPSEVPKIEVKPLSPPVEVPKSIVNPVPPEKDYSKEVTNLVEMGFVKEEALAAVKAARGNLELAIEFLYNGIPTNLPQPQQGQGQGGHGNDQSELRAMAKVIKVISAQNPNSLQNILMNIQQTDPDLMNLIKENETEFKNILQEPITAEDIQFVKEFTQQTGNLGGSGLGTGGMGNVPRPNQPQQQEEASKKVDLTKEEYQAVQRLMEMGFTVKEATEAYIACDKNEEMAANFLFENKF